MSVPLAAAAFLFKTTAASPQDTLANPVTDLIGSRTASNASNLYVDGSKTATNGVADSGSLPGFKPAFGALATSNSAASGFVAFREQVSFWGSSLSSTDVTNLRARVAALKTALGR